MRFFVFGKEISLRENWKRQIKVGLADGKHIVDLFSTEPRSKIFNQINLLTNFVGTIDSLAAFIQEYDPKTEQQTFKNLKKVFTDINRKLELTSDKRFGHNFREIYFELRSIEFSFVIFNKFLEKLEELECISQAECETGMQWTIKLFKNDFDIEDQYRHIFQATLNGTRFSKMSLLQQVKETSGCNEKTIWKFGTNLLLKLFKAQQIMVVYGKLAKTNNNSISQIHKWTKNMYEFRSALQGVVEECSSKNVCKKQCNKGKCIHLSKVNRNMCSCPNYFDGDNCQSFNQVVLAKDTVAILSTLNQVPKVGDIIDTNMQSNVLTASLKCVSFAYEMIQKASMENIDMHVLTSFDLGSFYNTYLSLYYLIKDARKLIKCDETLKTVYMKSKLKHTAYHLTRALFKINSYFNYRQSDNTFQPESLLARVIGINKNEACSKNFRAKIDNLWIQFHIAQANGFSVLLQVRHILENYSPAVLSIFKQRTNQQIKFITESTCSASIKHSANVHCDQYQLMKNIDIENKCIKGYARKGPRFIKCQNITSVCIPCACNPTGAISTICNSETGHCQCKGNFIGKNCDMEISQDCKLSDWTTWSICSKSCGMGGEQKRYRHIVIQQRGNGKPCQGNKVENKTCFKRCCNGAFECKDSSECFMGIKCQPCNCDHEGSTSGICQPINGACACKQDYAGRCCKEKKFIDCSAFKTKRETGIYKIYPKNSDGFEVYCDFKTDKGGWTVFQRRLNGKTDFYRGWEAYKNGFGNLEAEFWLGNEKIHSLTKQGKYELRVDISDFNGNKAYATYSTFSVGDASTNYKLTVAGYSGNAGEFEFIKTNTQ
ncbi:Tenascin-R,Ryncolin-2,Ficolin-3,Veficolin-1,Ryncolin-1,Fibrinogen C domain-containing protein 1-A,Fibrinogen C domain-containing protein 1,Fibrinogen C domain-containing protein 1-B,Fibroleukin,Ficolin-2,Tenascin,Ficolin-1,Fibrinogen-like protein A,Ryncolin-3,Angiopoietin-related protein 7,Angiopoietin-4,Ryncolin-4 [Mytilus edulis]|uniref:Fibrinogen C-terminal domain-containing protein n=2 Tax=Mytilus TaxID=6548 RepID=A0A8S3QH72_MYTED|nr:Tenascin-R,Ryncolin-2,Ficolin-3,Veficolin-1,Ryncolin-1,Fibrinogen C domain-containing protein 1-A,Fibrinogen C domain-containing protein 1,Fibrinogen C domain-containing protein 1-B,Fibroleukin,Ficolin-2,Tenascin,Ficolin-1,Fibrinogen-like protein A,Ryncolin-3,Angiopoietin-related protein 7,Angiopoietin-4,Ryncolin-4 [Mytilus edulis]